MCLNIGTSKNHHFPVGTNGEVVVLGVPILKHLGYHSLVIGQRPGHVCLKVV